jgi:hypothetical protein
MVDCRGARVVGTAAVIRGGEDPRAVVVAGPDGVVVAAAAVVLEASCGAVVEPALSGSAAGELHAKRQVKRARGAVRQGDIENLFRQSGSGIVRLCRPVSICRCAPAAFSQRSFPTS